MSTSSNPMPFSKGNYVRLLISIAIVAAGFFIMSLETSDYGQGVLGMTLGPIIVLSGFVVAFWAIFHLPSKPPEA